MNENSVIESSLLDASELHVKKEWYFKDDNGLWNAMVLIREYNKPLRGRSEVLVVDSKNKTVYLAFKPNGSYSIPGGGWEPDENRMQSSIREVQEEARLNVTDVIYSNSYVELDAKPKQWMMEKIKKENWWYGKYIETYVGEYAGKFTGHINEADKDDMIKIGKFYKIKDVYDELSPYHQKAIDDYMMKKESGLLESSLPLPDNGRPIQVGDISFVYKNTYHPIYWVGDEPYRPRVETLVIKNGKEVFLRTYDTCEEGSLYRYRLPGGSLDNDSTKEQQAENETNEEALLSISEIHNTGLSYYHYYEDGKLLKGGDICIKYKGTISDIFIAKYKGKVDKSTIEKHDLDDDMATNGKFYPIIKVCQLLRPEHVEAIMNSGLVDDDVKGSVRLILRGDKKTKIPEAPVKESIVLESDNPYDCKSPKEFQSWMSKNIKYNHQNTVRSAEEVITSKLGDCHDQSILEDDWFTKKKIPHGRLFMIEYNKDKGPNWWEQRCGSTHTILYFKKSFRLYWFEHAWQNNRGIHGPYKSMNELKDDIRSKWNFGSGYNDLAIMNLGHVEPGMTLDDYVMANAPVTESTNLSLWGNPVPKNVTLYHASPTQGIKYIEPRQTAAYKDLGPVVFCSRYKSFAACFGTYWNDTTMKQGTDPDDLEKASMWIIDKAYDWSKPCSMYILENDGSFRELQGHPHEYISPNKMKVKREIKFDSYYSMVKAYDIEVFDNVTKQRLTVTESAITEMTTSSSMDKDYIKGERLNLSSFKKIKISKSVIDKMKKTIKSLSHVRLDNTDGYIYTDENKPVAVIVVETKDNGEKWIQALEIFGEYKGHGLSNQLLDVAVNELSATELSVNKKNDVAYSLYKKYGFKTKSETDNMYMMTLENYYTTTEAASVSKYYFLSTNNMDNKTLQPRIPDNYFTKNGYEDIKQPRVSFAPSIDQCLMALPGQKLKGVELYVHIPIEEDISYKVIKPTQKQVPDSVVTGEIWVTEPVLIKCIGKIKVTGNDGIGGPSFSYGGHTDRMYKWNWKWVEKMNMTTESLETLVNRPFLPKKVTLYHGTDTEFDIIRPTSLNAGTILSEPRMSSFWSFDEKICILMALRVILMKEANMDKFITDIENFKCYVCGSLDELKIIETVLNKHPVILYTVSVDRSMIGMGHHPELNEATIDVPIRPHSSRKLYFDDLKSIFELVDDVTYESILNTVMKSKSKKFGRDGYGLFTNILFHSDKKTMEIRKKCKSLRKEPTTESKSYKDPLYRITYDGDGIYNAIKIKVGPSTWKELLANDKVSWLPKPPEYTDNNVSYFTKKGFDKFTKTTMPLFSKYIEDPKLIDMDKVNGISNVVYSDDYQVVVTEAKSIGANTTGMKRSELPDEMFGIPSQRKYELDTEKHVRSAIKLFNWVDPKYEKELATNIIKRMKYFNITDVNVGPKNRFGKYYKGGNKK